MNDEKTIEILKTINPALYVCATPIGNLGDISRRLEDILKNCDYIFCEDKRRTILLLKYLNISKKLFIYNDHSQQTDRDKIVELLKDNKSIALLSDAGTPCINDPGVKLIRDLRKLDLPVYGIPGPNAAITALSISGVASDRFTYMGFVPAKQKQIFFKEVLDIEHTVIIYDTAKKLEDSLKIITELQPDRNLVILREITKLYEEYINGTANEILSSSFNIKGEIVVIISPMNKKPITDQEIINHLKKMVPDMHLKDAAQKTSQDLGVNKRRCYQLGIDLE